LRIDHTNHTRNEQESAGTAETSGGTRTTAWKAGGGTQGTGSFVSTIVRRVFRIARTSLERFVQERAPEASASLGFYAVFSLFPMLLLLAVGSSFLLEDVQAQERVLGAVVRVLPVSGELVSQNILSVLESRGAVGIVGIVGLLWAATNVFTTLVRNLSRAWPGARLVHILRARLTALIVVLSLIGLAVLFLLARTVVCVPASWNLPTPVAELITRICQLPAPTILSVFMLLSLTLLYRLIPSVQVLWREAALGGLIALVGFRAATSAFTWYLNSGLARYNVVYGSLGTLLALLSWIYMVSAIALFGAHVSAAIATHTRAPLARPPEDGEEPDSTDDRKEEQAEVADSQRRADMEESE